MGTGTFFRWRCRFDPGRLFPCIILSCLLLSGALSHAAIPPRGMAHLEYDRTWSGIGPFMTHGQSVAADGAGNAYIGGVYSDEGRAPHHFVSKLNPDGSEEWTKSFATDSAARTVVAVDTEGNLYVAGTFFGIVDIDPGTEVDQRLTKGASDIFLVKLDRMGGFVWGRTLG